MKGQLLNGQAIALMPTMAERNRRVASVLDDQVDDNMSILQGCDGCQDSQDDGGRANKAEHVQSVCSRQRGHAQCAVFAFGQGVMPPDLVHHDSDM